VPVVVTLLISVGLPRLVLSNVPILSPEMVVDQRRYRNSSLCRVV